MNQDRSGFVCVRWRENSPLYKFECTETKPKFRPEGAAGSDLSGPRVLVHYFFCEDFECLEAAANETLRRLSARNDRGWFECSQQEAIDAVLHAAEKENIRIFFEQPLLIFSPGGEVEQAEEGFAASKTVDAILRLVEHRNLELKRYKRLLDEALPALDRRTTNGDPLASGQKAIAIRNFEGKCVDIDEALRECLGKLTEEALAHVGEDGVAKLNAIADSAKCKLPRALNEREKKETEARNIRRRIAKNNENLDRILREMGVRR